MSTNHLVPLFDRLLLKAITNNTNASGLYVPMSETEKTIRATVEALGSGCDSTFSLGDTVLFNRFTGTLIEVQDQTFYIAKQIDILAKEDR